VPDLGRVRPPGIPPAEVEITADLARSLVEDQHPDLAGEPIRLSVSGWDNTTFRLGDDLAIRLPRRQLGADMIVKEQQWLPGLAQDLPLPTAAPIRIGDPGRGYPWPWSIVPWIEGESAELAPPNPEEAAKLGAFLRLLHSTAPHDAPLNPWRGGPLAERAFSVEQRLDRIEPAEMTVPIDRVRAVWDRVKNVPIDVADRRWLHGDLHPRNVIVAAGEIKAVIDWGDLCAGDPATDLSAAWLFFPAAWHAQFLAAYGAVSEATRERAIGWAIFFGVVMVDAGRVDDTRWAECGNLALQRICS
jgi:aminoglycoside phosphotransferase (APT) family kinase protein